MTITMYLMSRNEQATFLRTGIIDYLWDVTQIQLSVHKTPEQCIPRASGNMNNLSSISHAKIYGPQPSEC